MHFELSLSLLDDAAYTDPAGTVAEALRRVAEEVRNGPSRDVSNKVRDVNGNTIGHYYLG